MRVKTGWLFTDARNFARCPKCAATEGHHCRTPKGVKAKTPHTERTSVYLQEIKK